MPFVYAASAVLLVAVVIAIAAFFFAGRSVHDSVPDGTTDDTDGHR